MIADLLRVCLFCRQLRERGREFGLQMSRVLCAFLRLFRAHGVHAVFDVGCDLQRRFRA